MLGTGTGTIWEGPRGGTGTGPGPWSCVETPPVMLSTGSRTGTGPGWSAPTGGTGTRTGTGWMSPRNRAPGPHDAGLEWGPRVSGSPPLSPAPCTGPGPPWERHRGTPGGTTTEGRGGHGGRGHAGGVCWGYLGHVGGHAGHVGGLGDTRGGGGVTRGHPGPTWGGGWGHPACAEGLGDTPAWGGGHAGTPRGAVVPPWQEGEMPDEVNIDDLLELETDEERAQKLRVGWFGEFFWGGGGPHASFGGGPRVTPPPPPLTPHSIHPGHPEVVPR